MRYFLPLLLIAAIGQRRCGAQRADDYLEAVSDRQPI